MTSLTRHDHAMLRGQRSVPAISRLGGGTLSTVADNQPYRAVGSDAVVYQLRQATGKVIGLRCWLEGEVPPELGERYRALGKAETLRQLRTAANSPIVSSISYFSDGLQVEAENLQSETRPVVALDWLMGPTVLAAVDRACKASDSGYLAALAEAWRRAVTAAAEVGFVHGDLAPDNAILRPKEGVAFVDYDTAWWPGAPSIPKLAPAVAYAHPHGGPPSPGAADDFASFLIYVSLRILAIWPGLRGEHGQPSTVKGAALLFQPRDLASPDGSPLFGKLRVLDDPAIQGLVGLLREVCLGDATAAPGFADAIDLAANVARSRASDLPARAAPGRVGSLISNAAQAVRGTGSRGTDRLRAAPPADMEHIESAWPKSQPSWRPERLVGLSQAIRNGDLAAADAEWSRVSHEPGVGALAPSLAALRARNDRVTDTLAPSPSVRREKRSDDRRQDIRRRLANALDADDRAALRDLAISGDLDEIPDLNEATTRRLVSTLAVAHLERAIESDDDVLIVDAWDDGLFGDSDLITPVQRQRVDLAFDRRAWLADVRAALRKRNLSLVETLFETMPENASDRLSEREQLRIQRLRDQFKSVDALRHAVFREQDADVVESLKVVERLGAPIPNDMPWREITGVVNRFSLMSAVRQVVERPPLDLGRLSLLLPQLRDAYGGEMPGPSSGIDFAHLDLLVKRSAQVTRLREVIKTGDDRQILNAAYPDLYGIIPVLDRNEQARIERAVAAANRALRRSGQRVSRSGSSSETVATSQVGSD